MNEHVKMLIGSSIVINRAASLLDENNIPTLIKDNVESARLAGFGTLQNEVELYIYKSDLKRAQLIIEEFRKDNQI
ncbi:putative signal transducing protein [Tunicatimonas pelagia]|uniref:putative signal transducing protein n=1 Tax=Tunicatimonas pelagia TaxID=931531 RepID=UPI0026671C60|nr:DUF2007 domain-containing protein [Tunicatimonas pelagia]WKN46272.1 DUF2007 domain-containing protein [Tunicatimonas pelagia]